MPSIARRATFYYWEDKTAYSPLPPLQDKIRQVSVAVLDSPLSNLDFFLMKVGVGIGGGGRQNDVAHGPYP